MAFFKFPPPPPFSEELQDKIALAQTCFVPCDLGAITLANRLVLAPMAGYTSVGWRQLMTDLGAALTTSELISANAVHYRNVKTMQMITLCGPRDGIQIFGRDPALLAAAAQEASQQGAAFVELNLGCPVRKVAAQQAGAMLMAYPALVQEILAAITAATDKPVGIKLRTGIDQEHRNAPQIIDLAAQAHLSWATVHGRTKAQGYQGHADWPFIETCAAQAKIPVIGNGDLTTPQQIAQRLQSSACAALMIGRAALQRPFIFLEGSAMAAHPAQPLNFTGLDYAEIWRRLGFYVAIEQEGQAVRQEILLRKYLMELAAGFPGAASLRQRLGATPHTATEVLRLGESYFTQLGSLCRRP